MTAIGGFYSGGKQRHWHNIHAIAYLFLILSLICAMPGCRGCRQDAAKTPEELEKELAKKKEPIPPFVANRFITQPARGKSSVAKSNKKESSSGNLDPREPADRELQRSFKVGHWTGISWENVKANETDFVGEMEITPSDSKQALPLQASPFDLTISRQAVLPKGQAKNLDSVLFIPPNSNETFFSCQLNATRGGRPVLEVGSPVLQKMPSYQYHFIVLARVPEQYGFLNNLYSVKPFKTGILDRPLDPYFLITPISGERVTTLPAHPLLWTSVACVLWDDADPTALATDVQEAFLDWLHWGGQVIISGPDTLDTLKGSFLEPYLPATAKGTSTIGGEELAEINKFSSNKLRKLVPPTPWSGIQFEKHPRAEYVPNSSNLLVQRRVGRGRIIVSAFRLGDRDFANWPGVDEFLNAFLLNRPPRRFVEGQEAQLKALWADGRQRFDAARISNVRFFTRDAGLKWEDYCSDVNKEDNTLADKLESLIPGQFGPINEERTPIPAPGVAAWNDFNPVSSTARELLLNAAQVAIPDRTFVFLFLFVYLAVLVPFNWSIFRTFDRVEWAWIAAPIIAILSTGLVIKLAQLDIGFIRARTEIAVLEIQGDHPHAHLTRYNALYTSLSTPYDFTFDDSGAVILPFPKVAEAHLFTMQPGQERRNLRYNRAAQATLEGLPVPSNSTALMHSEEMFNLGGKISLKHNINDKIEIVNQTKHILQGTGIIKKMPSGNLQVAWLGDLQSGAIRAISWEPRSSTEAGRLWPEQRDQSPLTAKKSAAELKGELNIRNLLDNAEKLDNMRSGDIKLLAWIDTPLPGLKINPAAPQSRNATLVIAHLDYGGSEQPRPDVNTPNIPITVENKE